MLKKYVNLILLLIYIIITILLIYFHKINYTFLNTTIYIVISILLNENNKNLKKYIYLFIALFISTSLIFIAEYSRRIK